MIYIYTRLSASGQNETSLEVQEISVRNQLKDIKDQITVIQEVGSGKDTDERPMFLDMLSKLKRGDIVAVYDQSILSRSAEVSLLLLKQISDKGARVFSNAEYMDLNDSQIFTMQSLFSEYQREIQRQKSLEGMARKKKKGDWVPSNNMFGYDNNHKKSSPKITENNDAKYVRMVYQQFIEGSSYTKIARDLSNILNKRVKAQTVIRWIRNPLYMGYYFRQSVVTSKDRSTFYKRSRAEVEKDLIKSKFVPAIVSPEIWWKAWAREMVR